MRRLIRFAILNRKITLFMLIVLMGAGSYSFYLSPRQAYPEINPPVAMVTVIYPGASPADVEERVTSKIVDELEEIEGYEYTYTYSYNSASVVFLRLVYGTEVDTTWNDVKDRLVILQAELPKECQTIQFNTDLIETAGLMVAISGENYSYKELNDVADTLKDTLKNVNGIKRFEIVGKQEKEVSVKVDYQKLNRIGLSLGDLYGLLQAQNVEIPSGQIDQNGIVVNLRTSGRYHSLEDIRKLVVGGSIETGQVVTLEDIASVEFQDAASTYKILQNGNNAILLVGYFQKKENVVLIGKDVDEILTAYQKTLPEDILFERIHYQPDSVKGSINDFLMSLLQGIGFVLFVVFIGMGFRNALIVSTALPASIMISFIIMRFFNIELHQISIAALIVALGMLVDNAIVIIDSIQVKLDSGLARLEACITGAREVAVPILTSTLTTIAAFLPFLLLPSIAGEYISSLPSIIMISLSVSYVVAILISPSLAFIFLRPSATKKTKKNFLRSFFERSLLFAFQFRMITTLIIIGILAFTVYAGFSLDLKFFPYADTDIIYIDLRSENAASILVTEDLVHKVNEILKDEPLILSTTMAVGGGIPKFYNTLPVATKSNDKAQFMLRIDMDELSKGEAINTLEAFTLSLQQKLESQITGGRVNVKMLEQAEPLGAPIQLRLLGTDLDQLGIASVKLQKIMSSIPGTSNVDSDFEDRVFEYVVHPNLKQSSTSGITQYDMQNEISLALRGRTATTIRLDDGDYSIQLESNVTGIDDLLNFQIKSAVTNRKVPLSSVAVVEIASEYNVIKSYSGDLSTIVMSDVLPGYNAVDIQKSMLEKINVEDYPGIEFKFTGENEKINENFGNIGSSGIIAVLLVYSILLMQFRSFTQPLIILLTIPLSAIGSFLGLYILGYDLSFVAMLGIVSLLGIVVNNAIVLIDFINLERTEGKSVKIACIDAVEKRFRPIMLTTATTVIGLVPLFLSGSALFVPLSVALMSGLIVSTLLTLIVIPMVYLWTHKDDLPMMEEAKKLESDLKKLKKSIYNK